MQHVDGHAGPGVGHGAALTHPLRLAPGTRLARILSPANVGGGVLTVNSYHHQGVRPRGPRARVRAGGVVAEPAGELVEAFEAASGPFRMAVQCHPERTESTPQAFDRLFAFFVDACRGPAAAADGPREPGTGMCRRGPCRARRPDAGAPRSMSAATRTSRRRAPSVPNLEPAGLDDPVEELARPGLVGLGEDLGRRPLLEDPARVEEADAVRDVAGEAHLVGRDDHRHAARRELADDVEHLGDELGVERGRDLVEQQEVRLHRERPHDRHPLLLAAREAVRVVAPALSARPNRVEQSRSPSRSASARGSRRTLRGASVTLSSTRMCGNRLNAWNTIPIRRRMRSTFTPLAVISSPSIRIRPASIGSSRLMQRRSVDLPLPEAPMSATTSCSATSRSMPRRTSSSPNDLSEPLDRQRRRRGRRRRRRRRGGHQDRSPGPAHDRGSPAAPSPHAASPARRCSRAISQSVNRASGIVTTRKISAVAT